MAMRAGILSLLLTLVELPATSLAAEAVQAESRISTVTVFPDRAEVTRVAEAALPAGESTVALAGLPASLFAETVRVRGAAEGRFQIGSVETRQVFAEEAVKQEERRLNREVEELGDQR
ncbi:MAG: DUF4140 domain-containing protein, partial [Rhodospirillales bacterium]|nr:DUF4140 domain-containing protein [Rhodospirillales bacterium]